MKARYLTPCILLPILAILLLSTAAQATEYREVKAEDILKQIKNGEEVNYTYCRIVGELNASKTELGTVPSPYFNKLVERGFIEKTLNIHEIKENLSVIESNIKITNSIFENYIDFSNIQFNNSANFNETTFNNSANFNWTTFNNSANFNWTTFKNQTDFYDATFNNSTFFYDATFNNSTFFNEATFNNFANFSLATFNNSAYFTGATFNNSADFNRATFNNSANFFGVTFSNSAGFNRATFNNFADFFVATFKNHAYFSGATFNNSAYFTGATFNNSANFNRATFNTAYFTEATFNNSAYFLSVTFSNSAGFGVPDTSENIKTDGKSCEIFMKAYNELARYSDADNIYYNFRKYEQEQKSVKDFSKWIDALSWVTCGYGTKLSYTLYCTVFFIILFAIIYKNPSISCKNENKKIPMRLCWGEPGIYRKGKDEEESVSFLEALYFSADIFTRLGSTNWQQRGSFRKWVSLEGVIGWIIFALVSATLMRLFIRP